MAQTSRTDQSSTTQSERGAASCDIRVHAFQTGRMRLQSARLRGRHGPARLFQALLDREWSEWLPIHAWLIEHPEGPIVVDTGLSARATRTGYFPSRQPYHQRGVEFDIAERDEIGPQLENRWLDPSEVRTVILTHLHCDQIGGLHHFPHSNVLVHRPAYERAAGLAPATKLRMGHSNIWPEWFVPTVIDPRPEPIGPFSRSVPITADGRIAIVPTPGHTPDHVSVIVRATGVNYFIAGDASYTEEQMRVDPDDGASRSRDVTQRTLATIRAYAQSEPMIYLPTHDPLAAGRLEQQTQSATD